MDLPNTRGSLAAMSQERGGINSILRNHYMGVLVRGQNNIFFVSCLSTNLNEE